MQRVIVVIAIVGAVLGAVALRVVVEGRHALADGDAALRQGQHAEAIFAYEQAARWYLPLAPHVEAAYAKLRALAASPDPAVSLSAWRAVRSAARATRTLWTPHEDDLAAADDAIAKLAAADPRAATREPAWHRERLARDGRSSIALAVLAATGIVLWLAGMLVLARRGIAASGDIRRRVALASGAAILVGITCWLVGLYAA